MSALPTADEGRGQVVGVVGSSTLPRGATTASDDYTIMQVSSHLATQCVYS